MFGSLQFTVLVTGPSSQNRGDCKEAALTENQLVFTENSTFYELAAHLAI